MALWCICMLAAPARAAELPAASVFDFDLPAAPLAAALQAFNAQCGAAAGMDGVMPALRTRAVRGRLTPLAALQEMLVGTGLQAVPTGALAFRLERVAPRDLPPRTLADGELSEILVTATKRSQSLLELPLSITVVDGDVLDGAAPLADLQAALDLDAGTSSTNLGPGRNRHFIRGVADSAFLGPSQATVSLQFDEVRTNYSAPDPDLRLVDVQRVEVLKGPQGPLYGTGALGGVLHVVPRHPSLGDAGFELTAALADTAHGGLSPAGSAMLDLPLRRDVLGLRAVAYAEDRAGWIDNAGGRDNANGERLAGGRLALRSVFLRGWTLDLQGALQRGRVEDSQYLPAGGHGLSRSGVLPEPRDNDFDLLAAVLRGSLWGGELVFSSSHVRHEVNGTQDASAAAAHFAATAPLRYLDRREYRLLGNELRFSRANATGFSWLLGIAQLEARDRIQGELVPAPVAGATVLEQRRHNTDLALFGEAGLPLAAELRLTSGMRLTRVRDRGQPAAGGGEEESESSSTSTATPSLALDWHSSDRRRVAYLRVARAVRPGGLNPAGGGDDDDDDGAGNSDDLRRFQTDDLTSLDLGWRQQLADGAVVLQSALFASRWRHVQSDYLQDNGLIGTRNVGDAGNLGFESQLQWMLPAGWAVQLGMVLQRARLEDPTVPAPGDDPRLPVVPDVRGFTLVGRQFNVAGWHAGLQLRADYTGSSRLSFDADLDRRTPAAFQLGANLKLARGGYELRLLASNLLDSRADTFAYGNPFSLRAGPQRTPRQPRTLTLRLSRSWP